MKPVIKYSFLLFLFFQSVIFSQSNLEINGYLQNMETVWVPEISDSWIFSNSIANRFNLSFFANDNLIFKASLRNIFDYGQFVSMVPSYSNLASEDDGYLNLTKKITSGDSYVFYSNIDRLNLTYVKDNFEIQIGRQRINWGINSVWTPNDIFNSSSFINFDYAEKPGSDALRVQYYFDYASSLELVGKLDIKKDLTLAAKYQINKWDYDFQFIGGLSEYDQIYGLGWSGSIATSGFTGEATYFNSRKSDQSYDQLLVSSIGWNYTFSNSLFVSAELLYNSEGRVGKLQSRVNLFDLDYSAKNLSQGRYSIFLQSSYPITSLINSSIAGIINPTDNSLFVSPSAEFSLNEDVYLLLTSQIFVGDVFTEWGEYGEFYYMRIKWNF